MPRNKYGAKPTVIDNIRFHSKRESERYLELKLLQRAGKISHLTMQPKFPIVVKDKKICVYIADFMYRRGLYVIVEDVKGAKTALYSIKKKLVEALYDFEITEIR